jgi:3-hydroxyanthranilate 3,4-dioxygenase
LRIGNGAQQFDQTSARRFAKMETLLPATDLWQWIERNRDKFQTPSGARLLFEDSEFVVLVIQGPNDRSDFHVDPSDELFYQIKGDIWVETVGDDGKRQRHDVKEGQLLLVPHLVPHSPQRPAGTTGFVVERKRRPDESESFVWFCEKCGAELNRIDKRVSELTRQINQVIRDFKASSDLHRCQRCGYENPAGRSV